MYLECASWLLETLEKSSKLFFHQYENSHQEEISNAENCRNKKGYNLYPVLLRYYTLSGSHFPDLSIIPIFSSDFSPTQLFKYLASRIFLGFPVCVYHLESNSAPFLGFFRSTLPYHLSCLSSICSTRSFLTSIISRIRSFLIRSNRDIFANQRQKSISSVSSLFFCC